MLPGHPVLWLPFPFSFYFCSIPPLWKSPGLPKSLFSGRNPSSWISLAGIVSLALSLLPRTCGPTLPRVSGSPYPGWILPCDGFWREFPCDRISSFYQSGLSGLGTLSGEGMWHHFWFSVSRDLLWLLDCGRDSGFPEEPGFFLFSWKMSMKSPLSSSLELGSPPEPLAKPASDPGSESGTMTRARV